MDGLSETTVQVAVVRNEQRAKLVRAGLKKEYPDSNFRYEFFVQGCWRIYLILDGERISEVNETAAYARGYAAAIALSGDTKHT